MVGFEAWHRAEDIDEGHELSTLVLIPGPARRIAILGTHEVTVTRDFLERVLREAGYEREPGEDFETE